MHRLKKGDEAIVITGKDKGRRGNIVRICTDGKVLVENANVSKRHQRPNPQAKPPVPGGIVEKEVALDGSNVMIFNPTAEKGDRVGMRTLADGRKVRYFKSNGEVVDR